MITIPGRIPISIQPLFWLVAIFIALMSTTTFSQLFLAFMVILFSVLVHEFGHALTGALFKQKTRIELAAFGGFTYRQGPKLKLWEEFIVVVNGPLAGFALFVGSYFLLKSTMISSPGLLFMLQYAAMVNFYWTVINLIPVLPLDGGHLLSILLEAIFGFKGIKMAVMVGLVISIGISIFFFARGQFFIGALFLILTFESFRSLRYYKLLSEKDRDTDIQDVLRKADALFQAGKDNEALELLKDVRAKAKEGILHSMATQEIAEIYMHQGKDEEAYELLKSIRPHLSGESLILFQHLAYKNHDFKTVIEIGNQCYQHEPTYETAWMNAVAHGARGDLEPSLGWLECALREGMPSLQESLNRPEFDSIRQEPRFQKFVQSLGGQET